MGKFFSNLFKDKNDLNEKTFVGFLSFCVMSIFAAADIITGIMGKQLTIFNSFVIITIGAFGIAEAGKIFAKRGNSDEE